MPDNISLLPLPTYSPELNPVENVWEFLRGNLLSYRIWDTYEAILEACRDAWNKLMQMPDRIASLIQRSWAKSPALPISRHECNGHHQGAPVGGTHHPGDRPGG